MIQYWQMPLKRLAKLLVILFSVVVVSVATILLCVSAYNKISTHIPRKVEGQSQSFRVEGVYYPINVDQVSGIMVLENRILIWGYNLKHFGLGKKFLTERVEIVRMLPRAYAHFNTVSSDWTLTNSRYDVNSSAHTFECKHTGERFIIKLPQGNADIFFNVYELGDKRQLFIIAAGEWKVGPPSYFSYFIVQRKT